MVVVLIPDLGGELIQRFARHVAIVARQAIHPGDELVTLLVGER
jgi:hypothetical protein